MTQTYISYGFKNDVRKLAETPETMSRDFLQFSETVAQFRTELFDWYRALPEAVKMSSTNPLPHVLILQ
jgi:hypothetical protein